MSMAPQFEQFIKEKRFLVGVTPATVEWYRASLRWLSDPAPSDADLKDMILRMREHGLRPSSVNCHCRAINSYLRWSGSDLKVTRLKEEQRILPTFSADDVQKILKWRPKGFCQTRLKCFALLLTDTGVRSGEATGLLWADVDFDNLLATVHGKGGKDRVIPFSFELRRQLYKWQQLNKWDLVFPTRQGGFMGRRNVLRSVKCLCQRLGIAVPPRTVHSIRHFFASNYLRQGGNVFALQRVLGHSSLEMVRRYAALLTSDLQQIHEKISLLNPTKRGGF